jgi:hypothetical protein
MDGGLRNTKAFESLMMTEKIKLTGDTVTLFTDTPENIGIEIDLEVKLPGGILLKSFVLNGTIIRCQPASNHESPGYMLEVKIGNMSSMDKKILGAYIDFIERENMLKEIKVDFKAFEDVICDFGKKLRQLRETSEMIRNKLGGTLKLLIRNTEGKTTIH